MSEIAEPTTLEALQDIIQNNETVVVEFGAVWCGPCRSFLPHFKKFAELNPDILCVKVDVDDDPGYMSEYGIQSVPQVKLFVGSEFIADLKSRTVIKLAVELQEALV